MNNVEQIYAVVANFLALERQLQACMDYIPFTAQNRAVVSPKFTPIILESCSLIESIFKRITNNNQRHTITTYAKLVEPRLDLAGTTTILLAHSVVFLRPFYNWEVKTTSWWTAYNRLKHDRLGNYEAASYSATVDALAGLHQVLSRSEVFLECLAKVGWLNEADTKLTDLMVCRYVGCRPPEMPVESTLFVSPITDNFVSWNNDVPALDHGWDFSTRVKLNLWAQDELEG